MSVQDFQDRIRDAFAGKKALRLRGAGVSVHCVRVGNVAIPNERPAHLPKWLLTMYEAKRKFSMTPEKMAETYVWLAADPEGEQRTGGYWDAPNIEVEANNRAYYIETQKRLWDISAQLTGVETT